MVSLSTWYIGGYEHLPNIAHSLELVVPESDPDLFTKFGLFVLCYPFFCRNNQKIYSSCLRGLFNKKADWQTNPFWCFYHFWCCIPLAFITESSSCKGSLGSSIFKQADISAIGVRRGSGVYGEFWLRKGNLFQGKQKPMIPKWRDEK